MKSTYNELLEENKKLRKLMKIEMLMNLKDEEKNQYSEIIGQILGLDVRTLNNLKEGECLMINNSDLNKIRTNNLFLDSCVVGK